MQKTLRIVNRKGLHARASVLFVKKVQQFSAKVFVTCREVSVEGDSVIELLSLAAGQHDDITIIVKGEEALQILKELSELVESGFHEDT